MYVSGLNKLKTDGIKPSTSEELNADVSPIIRAIIVLIRYYYNKFKEWGYDTKIETYNILMPTPKIRLLEMVHPVSKRL